MTSPSRAIIRTQRHVVAKEPAHDDELAHAAEGTVAITAGGIT
jgi:hypothetical protein